ncbi:hypothetical protein SAMN05444972_101106 [Marininema halotolerans]|uniref:Uncharacterized protein n=1 Tax=Marininema halotolerans TaxID=1155944 RepID=A0A1I6NT46_9BACL|nr:hypothetical protein SAMN05444972_101106 [Marininema halotolerans]
MVVIALVIYDFVLTVSKWFMTFFFLAAIFWGFLWIRPMKWAHAIKIHNRTRAGILTVVSLLFSFIFLGIVVFLEVILKPLDGASGSLIY